jgi:hypothetical protein
VFVVSRAAVARVCFSSEQSYAHIGWISGREYFGAGQEVNGKWSAREKQNVVAACAADKCFRTARR